MNYEKNPTIINPSCQCSTMLVTIMKASEHYDYELNDIELLDRLHIQFALYNYCKFKAVMKSLEDKIKYINDQKHALPNGIVKRRGTLFSIKPSKLLELMEKEQILISNYKGYQYYIDLAESFVSGVSEPGRSLITDRYFNSMNWLLLESKYNFSKRQMNRIIERSIKSYYISNTT